MRGEAALKIEQFIKSELERRLGVKPCLVIHDGEGRYRLIAHSLAGDSTTFVDATDSVILARELALEAWAGLSGKPGARLVIYLPYVKPTTPRSWQEDPFSPFALGGSSFPDGDADSFLEICLRAFPAQRKDVQQLFDDGDPSFQAVNALDGGAVWPTLRALFGLTSERELLTALIEPPPACKAQLDEPGPWLEEARRLVSSSLGFEVAGSAWPEVRESLGRFILFSEFALDLPWELPASLAAVPRAAEDRKSLVYGLCAGLRDSRSTRAAYRELAEKVDGSLGLSQKFANVRELGERETFAFENRASLERCLAWIRGGDFSRAGEIIQAQESSLWYDDSSDIQTLWACVRAGLGVLDGLSAFAALREDRPRVEDFVRAYAERFAAVDTAYRRFEAFLSDYALDPESMPGLDELIGLARGSYAAAAESLQRAFLASVERESWVGPSSADQASVFKTHAAPRMESGERTAWFMVDALRYELARELVGDMPSSYHAVLGSVRARLPSITPVGMAALLPGADGKLSLETASGSIVPAIGSTRLAGAQERVAYLKSIYGDRVHDVTLGGLDELKKAALGDQVRLLVVRSTDIDAAGESLGAEALPMLSRLVRNLLRGLDKARKLGFTRAVVVTDHGFLLGPSAGAGGVVSRPDGAWEAAGARFLLGDGSKTAATVILDASQAAVPGYGKRFATPNGLGSFVAGVRYVHGGLSLQECVLPVITIDFVGQAPKKRNISASLGYRGGMTKKITTMRPSLDLSISRPEGSDLFDGQHEPEIPLAISVRAAGKEAGRVQAGPAVDPGSGCVRLKPGKAIKITLIMAEDHRGPFTVSVLDPVTQEQFAKLDLETDYTE